MKFSTTFKTFFKFKTNNKGLTNTFKKHFSIGKSSKNTQSVKSENTKNKISFAESMNALNSLTMATLGINKNMIAALLAGDEEINEDEDGK